MITPLATSNAASRSAWTLAQRIRVFVTAGVCLIVGLSIFWFQGARMSSSEPVSFFLDEIPPTESGLNFTHTLPAFHPYFDNVYPFLAAVSAAGCVADIDHDGQLDLMLTTSGENQPNHFYRNTTNANAIAFERVVIAAIDDLNRDGFTTDCVFADVDNDGWDDLFIGTAAAAPRLFMNAPVVVADSLFPRTFVDVTRSAGLPKYMNGFAASFLDIDRDGDLDLVTSDYFRARYAEEDVAGAPFVHNIRVPAGPGKGRMMPNHWGRADNGGEKHILLNDGTGKFVEADAAAWGLTQTRFTFDIGTADINQDGFTDLYFANDFGPDQLYLNVDGKRLLEVKGRFPTEVGRDSFKGMNADLHDVDNDGFPEIYVTNVFHPALPEGNLFWKNRPHHSGDPFLRSFTNIAADNGTKDGGWGWGAKFVDLDNDTDIDLVATNGYISGDPDREYWYAVSRLVSGNAAYIADSINWPDFEGRSMSGHQVSHVFVRGPHRFFDRAADVGVTRVFDGRGVIIADFDRDGRPDVVLLPQGSPPQLLRNRFVATEKVPVPPTFVGVVLQGNGVTTPSNAVGSSIKVVAPGQLPQYREVSAGNGMASQSMRWLHVGLGSTTNDVVVEVRWSDGTETILKDVQPGEYHVVKQQSVP